MAGPGQPHASRFCQTCFAEQTAAEAIEDEVGGIKLIVVVFGAAMTEAFGVLEADVDVTVVDAGALARCGVVAEARVFATGGQDNACLGVVDSGGTICDVDFVAGDKVRVDVAVDFPSDTAVRLGETCEVVASPTMGGRANPVIPVIERG